MSNNASNIREFILKHLEAHPSDIVQLTANHFKVSRTTVHRHINTLVKQGKLIKSGTTSNIIYNSSNTVNQERRYKITSHLNESDVYQNDFSATFSRFNTNINDICHYGFTEVFNNAIDHSRGNHIIAKTALDNKSLSISICDDGVGIFLKIAEFLHLSDIKESVLHLSKGKLTTDPVNHTGEGLFFSARVFDTFEIKANGLHYYRDNHEDDWGLQHCDTRRFGTDVRMTINTESHANLINVFKSYQDSESYEFNRTEIVVELSRLGEETLISRSQAKRVLQGLEKFQSITLDFKAVRLIGQGFVDEIFRVYQQANPDKLIKYQNTNDDVLFMIKRSIK